VADVSADERRCGQRGVTVDSAGNILVVDAWNHSVRRIRALLAPPRYRVGDGTLLATDGLAMLERRDFADVCFLLDAASPAAAAASCAQDGEGREVAEAALPHSACVVAEGGKVRVYAHRVVLATRCGYLGDVMAKVAEAGEQAAQAAPPAAAPALLAVDLPGLA
jgi:hypothetical protein